MATPRLAYLGINITYTSLILFFLQESLAPAWWCLPVPHTQLGIKCLKNMYLTTLQNLFCWVNVHKYLVDWWTYLNKLCIWWFDHTKCYGFYYKFDDFFIHTSFLLFNKNIYYAHHLTDTWKLEISWRKKERWVLPLQR